MIELINDSSKVYFTTKICEQGLLNIYSFLPKKIYGKVAVKIHSGEQDTGYYIRPEIISPLINLVNGTIIDANTPYGANRTNTDAHIESMRKHGFFDIAKCDIIDSDGDAEIVVKDGKRLKVNYIGSHLLTYDSIIIVNHFKGHKKAGFGGVLKDMSIGLASKTGKCWIHTAGESKNDLNKLKNHDWFIEAMADAAMSIKKLNKPMIFISFLNNLSADGDGCIEQGLPELRDIGIIASEDPVALDKASLDIIKKHALIQGKRECDLLHKIKEQNGEYIIAAAKNLGIGNEEYTLINIDS